MTWNYYDYNVLHIHDENWVSVIEDCGEDLERARDIIRELRTEYPHNKYVIQQVHCIARIVR